MLVEDSVIFLDTMSSEEDGVKNNDLITEELEQKERTDCLMSLGEYCQEIYEYLRKSEVYFAHLLSCFYGKMKLISNLQLLFKTLETV